jgi:hypothetical protein
MLVLDFLGYGNVCAALSYTDMALTHPEKAFVD